LWAQGEPVVLLLLMTMIISCCNALDIAETSPVYFFPHLEIFDQPISIMNNIFAGSL
jgi:hypothetical protein